MKSLRCLQGCGRIHAQSRQYFDNNVYGSLCLIEAAQQGGVRRFVFFSQPAAAVIRPPQSA